MVLDFKPSTKYYETFIPGKREPIIILHNLLQAGIFSKYMIYESKEETFVAGGELAKVLVMQEQIFLEGLGASKTEPVSDPLKQVENLLNSLRFEEWTA